MDLTSYKTLFFISSNFSGSSSNVPARIFIVYAISTASLKIICDNLYSVKSSLAPITDSKAGVSRLVFTSLCSTQSYNFTASIINWFLLFASARLHYTASKKAKCEDLKNLFIKKFIKNTFHISRQRQNRKRAINVKIFSPLPIAIKNTNCEDFNLPFTIRTFKTQNITVWKSYLQIIYK